VGWWLNSKVETDSRLTVELAGHTPMRKILLICVRCAFRRRLPENSSAVRDSGPEKAGGDERSALMRDIETPPKRARMFFYRSAELGGGRQSFENIAIEATTPKPANKNGTYAIMGKTAQTSVIVGIGLQLGNNKVNPVAVSALMTRDLIRTIVED